MSCLLGGHIWSDWASTSPIPDGYKCDCGLVGWNEIEKSTEDRLKTLEEKIDFIMKHSCFVADVKIGDKTLKDLWEEKKKHTCEEDHYGNCYTCGKNMLEPTVKEEAERGYGHAHTIGIPCSWCGIKSDEPTVKENAAKPFTDTNLPAVKQSKQEILDELKNLCIKPEELHNTMDLEVEDWAIIRQFCNPKSIYFLDK